MSHLWVLSAASGTGKTSLVKALLALDAKVTVAISHTTRKPRQGEVEGVDYYFVSQAEFDVLLAEQAFIEHAQVFDYFYGTSKKEVQERMQAGFDVLLEIDWQGAVQIAKVMSSAQSIFIFPPSYEQLRYRLESRAQDEPSVIERRLKEAKLEISQSNNFDYWIINDHFDDALAALGAIIKAHRYEKSIIAQQFPDLIRGLCRGEKE